MAEELGSLTPPVSPYLIGSGESEVPGASRPPCFNCAALDNRDGARAFPCQAYLASGALKRLLLQLDPSPAEYEAETIELFGFQWVTETALVESTALLFGLLRQQMQRLENMVQTSSLDFGQANSLHYEAEGIRQQCVTFLQYVKTFIFRYLEPAREFTDRPAHPYEELEVQLPSALVEELHALKLYTGRLSELPSNVLATFKIQSQGKLFPASWHLLHLHLDIHWSTLEILHLLGEKMLGQIVYAHQFMNLTGENLTNASLFEEHATSLIGDLIGLSVNRYTKVRPSEALASSPYPCTCAKELWALVLQLLDHRSKVSHTEPFWSCVNKQLTNLLRGASCAEGLRLGDSVHCKDPLGFSWWAVTHLAMLYQFSRNGIAMDKFQKQLEGNWNFVEKMLKRSCDSQANVLEEQLRMHLQCCLTLCSLWGPNLTTVTTLWEYYSKNLNSAFNIPWLGLKGLASVSKTPFSMLEVVKNCCRAEQNPDLYKSENSFHIFLRILTLQMKKGREANGGQPWKQIKGRIYSKFHKRKMEELTEMGFQNFFSLFLVLAAVAEIEDVTSRVSDLLDLLSPRSVSTAQRVLIWRGCFAFILMYEEKNLDIGVQAEKLAGSFQQVAKEFLLKTTDPSRKAALWTLLAAYVDGVQEVFEMSRYLHLSEEKLLNDGFSMLLPACWESKLNTVLNFVQALLAKLRSVYKRSAQSLQQMPVAAAQNAPSPLLAKERHLAIAAALWKQFFPSLKSMRLSQTPPPQLADTAAGFTLLAMDAPGTAPSELKPQPLSTMMQLFGWDDLVHFQLVSRYLSHLILRSALIEALSSIGCTSYQALSVRSWFRCVLQLHVNQPVVSIENNSPACTFGKTQSFSNMNMDQLVELTRVVLKLPEVESIFQRAQVEQSSVTQDPKSALHQFIKVVGRTYAGLQTLTEKSTMVSKCLEYIGDVLKYIKPYLVNKGPSEGLHLTHRTVGCLVKYWAPVLATSKAQQLLFRIIDCLLLPHAVFQQDRALPPAVLSALRESLPLYLQGLSVITVQSQTQGAYLKQQLRSIIQQYFGRFLPAFPSGSGVVNHPILLSLCEKTAITRTSHLRKTVLQVVNENYLLFKGRAPPPRLASVLSFLFEVLRRTESGETAGDADLVLPAVLKCLLFVNEPQVKKLSTDILQHVVENCQIGSTEGPRTQLTSILRQFIQEHIMIYDHQVYHVLEKVAVLDQALVIGLIPTVTQALKDSEYKQGLGRNSGQRDAYGRLLSHLGEAGQAEILKLEDDSC
ncbi:protein MMS22-like [Latimeria chalumnae]|uniref:protein MMS22-like n=1 Tax=Latimeria chalumnae TaxID=7897 RepID=UPI00313F029D